jgi:hypothetical protein
MQAESLEAEPQRRRRGLGGVAVAAQGGVEHVAEFSASVSAAMPEQHDVTGNLAGPGHLGAERERLPRIGEFRAGPLPRDPLDDVVAAHRLERDVPAHVFTAAVGEQGIGIVDD